MKHLKSAGALNKASLSAQIASTNALLNIQKKKNKSQEQELGLGDAYNNMSIKELMLKTENIELTTEERSKLVSLIELKKEHLDLEDSTVDSHKETLLLRQLQLKIDEKQLSVTKAENDLEIATLKTAAKRASLFRAGGTGEISPNEKFKIAMREADVRINMAQLDYNLTLAKTKLEKELLDLRLRVLEKEGKLEPGERENILADFSQIEGIAERQAQIAIDAAKQAKDAMGLDILADFMNSSRSGSSSASTAAEGAIPDMSQFFPRDNSDIAAEGKRQLEQDTTDRKQAQIDALPTGVLTPEAAEAEVNKINEAFANSEGLREFRGQLLETRLATQDMVDGLMALGPEGVLIGTITEGIFTIGDSLAILGDQTQDSAAKFEAASAIIGSIGSIMAAASQAKIAGIDKEIDAEKKRDGKSKETLEKIKKLEKKKEAAKKKAFEQNKKIQMAQTVVNTAASVMRAFTEYGLPGAILAGVLGAAQLAIIAGTTYQGGGSASGATTPSSISMGERSNKVDVSKAATGGELASLRGGSTANIGGQNLMPPPAFMGAQYRAQGGPTAGYVVGEQGPELFVPEVPGKIVPNDEMKQSQPVNVNFTIQAIDTTNLNDALVTQRGNIISMIREAANTYGETFLESVNDTAITTGQGKL